MVLLSTREREGVMYWILFYLDADYTRQSVTTSVPLSEAIQLVNSVGLTVVGYMPIAAPH